MILVFGSSGQVARSLQAIAGPREMLHLDRSEADLSDPGTCAAQILRHQPRAVINAAAYTAVDRAEEEEDVALTINGKAPGAMAQACANAGIPLVHISTDYVFEGTGTQAHTPEDPTNPQNAYGRTKLAGEEAIRAAGGAHAILRTSWVFSEFGNNFVKTMLRLMAERDELSIVADQVGTPTWARGLAEALWSAVDRPGLTGLYHWSDAGVCSWYDFAVAIAEEGHALGLLDSQPRIMPIPASDYPTPARRPAFSVLDKSDSWRDFEIEGTHWRVQLRAMLQEL